MDSCSICKKEKNLIIHHLSYDPEITTIVCWGCHSIMHRLSEKTNEQRNIIIDWVKQYGSLWKNGREWHQVHYKKGKERKEYQRNYSKKYEKTETRLKYKKEYRLKKRLEKQLKKIKNHIR